MSVIFFMVLKTELQKNHGTNEERLSPYSDSVVRSKVGGLATNCTGSVLVPAARLVKSLFATKPFSFPLEKLPPH